MSSEEAVSNQLSAVSSEPGDPLADAHCQHCGYSLRGLPENRCPECGTPLDPADFAKTYLPLWPSLLAWYLAASMAWPLWGVIDRPFGHPGGHQPGWLWEYLGLVPGSRTSFATTLTVVLGCVAVLGLRRRRDWGRKAAIAMLMSPILVHLCDYSYRHMLPSSGPPRPIDLFLWALGALLPPLLLVILLCTGLRRRSLTHRGQPAQTPLLVERLEHRKDWPLMMVILVATITIGHLGFLVTCVRILFEANSSLLTRVSWIAITLEEAVIAGGCLLTLLMVRRRPASVRTALATLAWLLVAMYLLRVLLDAAVLPRIIEGRSIDSFLRLLLRWLWILVGALIECALPIIGLWLFTRTLRPEDLGLPAGVRSKTTDQV